MTNPVSFKDSPVWQQSMQLAYDTYQLTAHLPAVERLNLSMQLQQKAIMVPSIIAAASRSGNKDNMKQACQQALSILAEMDTFFVLAGQLYPDVDTLTIRQQHGETENHIRSLLRRLTSPTKII